MKKSIIIITAFLFSISVNAQINYDNNTVTGSNASALGENNISSELNSFVSGSGSTASGSSSTALGLSVTASGMTSCSFGAYNTASGAGSVALGSRLTATQTGAIAIGNKVDALASYSYVLGYGLPENHIENNILYSLMVGFNSNIPTLFVSPSTGSGTTGKIGIGNITAPTAKLHIKSDNNEHASILLEPTGSYYGRLLFGSGTSNHYIQARSGSNMQFNTEDNQDFVFENGNVGIGTNQPKAKIQVKDGDIFIEDIDRGIIMKSPNGSCWRGTLNNTGMLEFVQVDCDDLAVSAADQSTSRDARASIYPNPAGNQISVNLLQDYVGGSLEISDISGKLLRTHPLTSTECNINISELSPGMYVFNILDDAGKILESKKIVKE